LIKFFLFFIMMLFPTIAWAEEPLLDQPRWSFELKTGIFDPSIKNWSTYYGKKDIPEYAVSMAYSFKPQIEVGAGVGLFMAEGSGFEVFHGTAAGRVTYDLFPLELFVTLRGVVAEDQLLVPYIGAGLSRMYYHEKVQGGQTVSGFADGYLARGGVEISLNEIDPYAANGMYDYYGVFRTAFFIEAEYTHAIVSSIDIGGIAYMGGLRFEF